MCARARQAERLVSSARGGGGAPRQRATGCSSYRAVLSNGQQSDGYISARYDAKLSSRVRVDMSGHRARVARWAAERATWKLANRGDNHYAADRRLYKKQMSELRKAWSSEDLMQRRSAYVAQREAAQRKVEKDAEKQAVQELRRASPEVMQRKAERAERNRLIQEREQKRVANEIKMGEKALAAQHEAEDAFRRKWLEGVLADYDVEGRAPTSAFSRERKRTWLNPDNFDKRLHLLMMRNESPVDRWNSIARELKEVEDKERHNERMGGKYKYSPQGRLGRGGGGDAASGSGGELSSSGGGATASELAARLRSITSLGSGSGSGGDGGAGGEPDGASAAADAVAAAYGVGEASSSSAAAGAEPAKGAAFLEQMKNMIADLDAAGPATASKPSEEGTTDKDDDGKPKE